MFADFSDDILFLNDDLIKRSDIQIPTKGVKNIYEVFRVISGSPLFVNDHFVRLEHSLDKSDINYTHRSIKLIKEQILKLCKENNKYFGNVELRILVTEEGKVIRFLGFISHYYPEPVHYIEGVKVDYIEAERDNPTVKAKYTSTRQQANLFIKDKQQYEVLLVNNNDQLTEGSRSNLFFIKGNVIYTAPDDMVLCGVTRLNVIRLLKRMHYKIIHKAINTSDIGSFEAAFLCGTSPGVLPISSIRNYEFDVRNSILRNIILHYNDQISTYITTKEE